MLKVTAAPLVVLIHVVGNAYYSAPVDSGKWLGYLALNSLPRCAVPIFIMVSGMLLIGRENTKEKVIRDVKRSVFLMVFWNIFYIVLQDILWGAQESVIRQILAIPVKNGPSGHLWYAYFLVWLYVFSPIVSAFYRAVSDRARVYFICATVLIPGLLDLYLKIFDFGESSTLYAFQLYPTLNYIGMMFLGRLIYEKARTVKKFGLISLLAALVGLTGTFFVSLFYAKSTGVATDIYFAETQLLPITYGAGVIGIAAYSKDCFAKLAAPIRNGLTGLSRCSIGIYFFHCFFLWTLGDINLPFLHLSVYDGPLQTMTFSAIVYLLSAMTVTVAARIPGLKRLVT